MDASTSCICGRRVHHLLRPLAVATLPPFCNPANNISLVRHRRFSPRAALVCVALVGRREITRNSGVRKVFARSIMDVAGKCDTMEIKGCAGAGAGA